MPATPDTHILQTQLAALSAARTPLHMPGHKRRGCPAPGLPHDWDLTEIDGADDLHGAAGILAQAMERTCRSPSSMAWNTDLWQLRAAMTVLPAGASARMPASRPTVAPLTR